MMPYFLRGMKRTLDEPAHHFPQGGDVSAIILSYHTTEMIFLVEFLEFLYKAEKLNIHKNITKDDEGYSIILYYDWNDDNHFYNKEVFITNDGESNWKTGDYDFDTINAILDKELEKQKERELKEQKRKQLIDRLTDEEKELLNLK